MLQQEGTSSLENAAAHVSKAWFPINTKVLEEIRLGIRSGRYENRLEPLMHDLKTDASLYILCIQKLSELVTQTNSQEDTSTPSKLFQQMGFPSVSKILLSDIESLISHKIENINELQSARLREGIISASASEILAQNAAIDPELGFSCALLRQLGLTLIAWNYPHVYGRALEALTVDNKNLELEIHKILGFTPSMLALTVSKKWGFSLGVKRIIGEKTEAPILQENGNDDLESIFQTLDKLCKIGECLARANDPENYPSALSDWESAETSIRTILGPDGVRNIQNNIEKNLRAYAKRSPNIFKVKVSQELKETIEKTNFTKQLLNENKFIEACPPLLKLQIQELYSTFSAHEISRESIQKLIKDIIPCAGFDRGCVFMIEPNSMNLVPLLKIGNIPESRTFPIKVSAMNLDSNPVATAFRCNTPIKQIESGENGEQIVTFSGALGGNQKTGVLYLEVSERLLNKAKADPELYFKAVRLCLNHCLNIR